MIAFSTFINSMLSSIATFLGSSAVIWITGCCVLLGIVAVIQRLCKL